MSLVLNKIYNEDCLEGMKKIADKSIDMILCDLPYGTTACKWDNIIPFEPLWEQYKRVIKDRGAIVLFGSEPFSSKLRMSNMKGYKYDWIWDKVSVSNPQLAKKQPLKSFELISVFGTGTQGVNYYPQGLIKINTPKNRGAEVSETEKLGHIKRRKDYVQTHTNYPKALALRFPRPSKPMHPTQKPVELFEYLIKTYTNKGETVLDNCMGSGTTAIACLNTNRNFIGFELDKGYFEIAKNRIEEEKNKLYNFNKNTSQI